MAGSVNKVFIIGNLGKDPEVRSVQSGSKVASLTVATSESWNDRNSGEKKERTEWHRVVLFGTSAENAERYLRKGSKVCIEGALQTRKWTDQSGQERYTTEVVVGPRGNVTFLSTPSDSGGGERRGPSPSRSRASAQPSRGPSWDAGGGPSGGDLDDEIPF